MAATTEAMRHHSMLQKQFSLHTVPSNVSLKWKETTGMTPNPEVALRYEPPPISGRKAASQISIESHHNFRPMDKKDVLYGSSILDLNHFESKLHGLADLSRSSRWDVTEDEKGGAAAMPSKSKMAPNKKIALLKSLSFLGFCFASALFAFGMWIPVVYIIR